MTTVLALDQSTSATKALLFDEAGQVLDRASVSHRQHYPQPGWVEHDAEELWQNTLQVLRTVLDRAMAAGRAPICLSLTNQRETIVVFDPRTGEPLHPALVWQDRRGDPLCAEQAACGRAEAIHARTGLRLDGYFSGSKLQWLIRHRPELRRRLETGAAVIGTIDTYLIHRLTEGRVFATDHTNASRTLLLDLQRLAWDDELCTWWEVPRTALPEIRASTAAFGETTLGGHSPRPLPICGVMGDSQASLFAQGCFEPGTAKATIGTGCSVLLNTGRDCRFSTRGLVSTLGWVHDHEPTYTLEGIIISAGATLAWLVEQLGLARNAAELEQLAAGVADSDGVYLVPAFAGLGLPYWRPDARAALVGLTGHSDRRHVARAALDAIAYQLRDALDVLQAESGVPLRSLRADGGVTANAALMQFAADLTGTPLHASLSPDCSPLGAARAGLLGMGVYRSLAELAALPRPETVYSPRGDKAGLARCWAGWQSAVAQILAAPPVDR